ncbi:spore coat assemly protein [Desulfonispora thiosulfatigenes DSM 11270]|uniref:Spore coat assemly protein n=1 Tax=Desulfonispora thiosulfatigenes DSM 11270 TaxID=656914 RepID=A0A1W1V0K4_DESTI|nr:sporulation peptidase YabG [Desulfonispora thiosulfatigenes]SMB86838.1 spore coat assemly protein [Desulfonispora thiosulfatigenes DSM 11270]
MDKIRVGDIVARKSHSQDILFKVERLIGNDERATALLRGMEVRLYADAPLVDLEKKNPTEVRAYRQDFIKKNAEMVTRIFQRRAVDSEKNLGRGNIYKKSSTAETFELPGKVLHIDGDKEYLDLCMTTYSQLKIKAKGIHAPESQHPDVVSKYLPKFIPDILVITGHDGLHNSKKDFGDVNNYRHSKYFIEAVRRAREFEQGKDDLIIFAGACQSHYEALIGAGANFASSPHRVMIHAYDPVFIVEKLAYSSIYDVISVKDIIDNTITGIEGVGGVDTRGRLRIGYPKSPY